MSYFDISESNIKELDGEVVIITGASSGIGLATARLFILKGATVIGADLQEPAESISKHNFKFHRTDVTSWEALCELFKQTHNAFGRIDVVFANAGIGPKTNYLDVEEDDNGELIEPTKRVIDINIVAVTNQVALAAYYMQRQEPKGGNIVLTASCTGYQRFSAPDYVVAKHGVIGLLRSMYTKLDGKAIRINAVAPSYTRTGLVTLSDHEFEKLGMVCQPADAVARSVGLLATDPKRHGQCLYSYGGRYVEMEAPMQEAMLKATGWTEDWYEEPQRVKIYQRYAELAKAT